MWLLLYHQKLEKLTFSQIPPQVHRASQTAREPPSTWRSIPSWTAQFQLKKNWWCDSGGAAARTVVWRFDRFLLIHFGNSVLVSTVFLLVSPLSTMTTVALKLCHWRVIGQRARLLIGRSAQEILLRQHPHGRGKGGSQSSGG